MTAEKSGKYWVTWAKVHAKNSIKVDDLEINFKPKVEAFIKALEYGGATVKVKAIDMDINWEGNISVKKKDGSYVSVDFNSDVKLNITLHSIGESYGV